MDDYINRQMGNYRLTKLLGDGGFAKVYLGEHIHLDNKKAAIKVLKGKFSVQDIKKFREEAQIIHHLRHPHIVQIIDFGIAPLNGQDLPFLVMDYAPYGSLSKRYPSGTRLPLATIISYVKPIAKALQYAHDKQVIHRDVKPANLLLGENREILLSDFGNAVIAHATQSMPEQDKTGTPPYMAPEQFIGEPRPASDQYALGIVIYEWLYGKRPFSGPHFNLYAYQHTNTIPISLIQRGLMIPPSIDEIVMRALAKNPKDRFDRVQDFADALEQAYREEIARLSEFTVEMLGQEYVQQILLDLIATKPGWWEKEGRAKILTLYQQPEDTVTIALSKLSEKAEKEAIAAIKNEKHEVFENMLDVIVVATPPSHHSKVWITLLQNLENKEAFAFLSKHRQVHFWLLERWAETSPLVNGRLVRSWLTVSWSEFGSFFSLQLPDEWRDMALATLLDASPTTPIPPVVVQGFEQHDERFLVKLFQQLLQAPQRRFLAVRLFAKLAESGYRGKMNLLHLLLSSRISERQAQQFIEPMLKAARLTNTEQIEFLEAYGERCIRYSPQLPILLDYVRYYLQALDIENLEAPSHIDV